MKLTGIFLFCTEELLDFVTDFTIWNLDIVFGGAIIRHEGEEVVVGNVELELFSVIRRHEYLGSTHKLIFLAGNVGDIHVMGRGAKIFELLAGKDIDGDKVDLSMTVLAGLGGAHFDNLAGAALDDHMSVLAKSGTLHRERGRGAGIGRLESMLMLYHRLLGRIA